ncbi:unnamed protein product [Lactuca virosa]|uniref:Uncharacterized protein n=1 Tax=Lactuca virosa TaxID=75947 RepID=A0AAU9PT94_9ASTR|nr:unnamed protein product [Lactuca virosa]
MIVDVSHPSFDVSTLSKLGFPSDPFSLPVHSDYLISFSRHLASSRRHHIRCHCCPSCLGRHPLIPPVLASNTFYAALAQQRLWLGYELHVVVIVFDNGGVYGGDRINPKEVMGPVVINVTIDIDHRGNKIL